MTSRNPVQTYDYLAHLISTEVKGRDIDGVESVSLSTIDLLLTTLFTGGHILFEDFPGSGKTFIAKTLADAIKFPENENSNMKGYQRVQCMVDLLPTDITGASIKIKDEWSLSRGPIFSNILLVDEINRTTPKVQSAFLEAMAEKQVTIEKTLYHLEPIFFLIATQNPFDSVGTFELPYAQIDRFIFKRVLSPLSEQDLRSVIRMNSNEARKKTDTLDPIVLSELLSAIEALKTPLDDAKIENDLISLHHHFTRRVCHSHHDRSAKAERTRSTLEIRRRDLEKSQKERTPSKGERVIAPHCTLSARTLRWLKRVVDFRVNLDRGRLNEEKIAYQTERHLTPLLEDLLRHRITLQDRHDDDERERLKIIEEIRKDVIEDSIQRARRGH